MERLQALRVAHQVRAAGLERPVFLRGQQPLHHAVVDHVSGELRVMALHSEGPVELLGFELDVLEAEVLAHAGQEPLAQDGEVRTSGGDLGDGAREVVIRARRVPTGVRALGVVPVVELLEIHLLPRPPHDVLHPAAVAEREQAEGQAKQ